MSATAISIRQVTPRMIARTDGIKRESESSPGSVVAMVLSSVVCVPVSLLSVTSSVVVVMLTGVAADGVTSSLSVASV